MYPLFQTDISAMNQRYKLADIEVKDCSAVTKRLEQFKDILDKEFCELTDVQALADTADDTNWGNVDSATGNCKLPVTVVVNLADLLGDIIVYCASEAQRWGIPLPQVLAIIMASNTSKLGADGQPIINPDNGKFEKGPNYWKPEPMIEFLMTNNENSAIVFTRDAFGVVTVETKKRNDMGSVIEITGQGVPSVPVEQEHPPGCNAINE